MRLDLTADAGPVPFTLTSPQMRLAWAKTGLFQSLTPDILAMVLDKEKTMPGPRQHMRAVVAELKEMYRHACWYQNHEPCPDGQSGWYTMEKGDKMFPATLFPFYTLRAFTESEYIKYIRDYRGDIDCREQYLDACRIEHAFGFGDDYFAYTKAYEEHNRRYGLTPQPR
jgi:hypothetical protein